MSVTLALGKKNLWDLKSQKESVSGDHKCQKKNSFSAKKT